MSLYGVIPARNEAATIRAVAGAARPHVDRLIVVDDGSDDGTAAALHGLDVVVLRNDRPLGKAGALARGFAHALEAGAEGVLTLDGDGQHDPEEIPKLEAAHTAHPGALVLGARRIDREHAPRLRLFANRFADFWVSWASGQRVPDSQTGFRLYPRTLLETVRPSTARRHGFVFECALIIDGARAGFPSIAVPVRAIYTHGGRPSYFRPGRDVWEIFCFIWWRILLRALYLPGLWRMLRTPTRWFRP